MITELESLILDFKKNIENLKELNSKTLSENKELKEELSKLNNQIQKQDILNEDLNRKYESLKLAKSIAVSSNDSHDAKIKINR